jgi:hypothetical protein
MIEEDRICLSAVRSRKHILLESAASRTAFVGELLPLHKPFITAVEVIALFLSTIYVCEARPANSMNLSLQCKEFGVGVVIDPAKPE